MILKLSCPSTNDISIARNKPRRELNGSVVDSKFVHYDIWSVNEVSEEAGNRKWVIIVHNLNKVVDSDRTVEQLAATPAYQVRDSFSSFVVSYTFRSLFSNREKLGFLEGQSNSTNLSYVGHS